MNVQTAICQLSDDDLRLLNKLWMEYYDYFEGSEKLTIDGSMVVSEFDEPSDTELIDCSSSKVASIIVAIRNAGLFEHKSLVGSESNTKLASLAEDYIKSRAHLPGHERWSEAQAVTRGGFPAGLVRAIADANAYQLLEQENQYRVGLYGRALPMVNPMNGKELACYILADIRNATQPQFFA